MPQVVHTGVHSGLGLGQPKKETCQLAKALYDNVAETPEELHFSKGDILTVLEQDPCDIKGWWLCSFKGRRGLCPGNRLKLMNCNDSKSVDKNAIHATKLDHQKYLLANESNYVVLHSIQHANSSPHFSSPINTSSPTPSSTLSNSSRRHRNNESDYEDADEEESCYDIPPSPVKVYNKSPLNTSSDTSALLREPAKYSHSTDTLNNTTSSVNNESAHLRKISSTSSVLSNNSLCCDETYDVPRHLSAVDEVDAVGFVRNRTEVELEEKSERERKRENKQDSLQTRAAFNTNLQSQSPYLDSYSPHFQSPQQSPIPTAYLAQACHNCPSPAASISSVSTDSVSIASTMDVASTSSSSASSNRSSLAAGMADYDVPKPFAGTVRTVQTTRQLIAGKPTPPPRPVGNKPNNAGRITPTSVIRVVKKESFDVPNSQSMGQIKELPLELTPALESLQFLETEAVASIHKLLEVAKSPNEEKPVSGAMRTSRANNIHVAIVRYRSALSALAEFAEGVLGNAMKASDKNLAGKLRPLVEVLQNSASRIHTLTEQQLGVDELEGIVHCAVGLLDEVKKVASFVQGNSTLLFKRNSVEWDIRGDCEEENGVTRKIAGDLSLLTNNTSQPPANTITTASTCLTPSTLTPGSPTPTPSGVITLCNVPLTNDDKTVLTFYARQAIHAAERVNLSIDKFLHAVEQSDPPKVFLERAKYLVVNAHNLVHIGDAIVRGVVNVEVKNAVQKAADALSEGLATHVQETRKAAEHFPSVQAVQEMVNSVAEVGHLSRTVKCILLQAAQP